MLLSVWEGPYQRHGPLWVGGLDLVQHFRTNALITGWICTALGAAISISIPDAFGLMIAFPLGIAGIILLILGFRADPEERVNIETMRSWQPEEGPMREAGRVMYRIDTLLDPPIRSTIKCGECGKVEWIDGGKPASYTCPHCSTTLWEEE